MQVVTEMAGACLNSEISSQKPSQKILLQHQLPWFALRVRERYRTLCEHMLNYYEFDFFSPCATEERIWSDRRKIIKLPLFPGYMFCRLDPSDSLRVLKTPGVMDIVSSGNRILEVSAHEILAVQTALAARRPLEAIPYLAVGERCLINSGPLRGLEGVVERHKGGARLLLAVEMLNRSVSVEVDASEIA